jgi:hypothetical protein
MIFDALEAERAECLSGVIRDWVERTATHGHGAAMVERHPHGHAPMLREAGEGAGEHAKTHGYH